MTKMPRTLAVPIALTALTMGGTAQAAPTSAAALASECPACASLQGIPGPGGTGGALTQTVPVPPPVPAPEPGGSRSVTPTVNLESSSPTSRVGQPVTFTATLPRAATGSVKFVDNAGGRALGVVDVESGVARITTNSLTHDWHYIQARYNTTSPLYNSAKSEVIKQVVTS